MEAMKDGFLAGSIKNGYTKETAETTFDYIERFAGYGFNKSHAFAYSKMAFELAFKSTLSRSFLYGSIQFCFRK